MPEEKVSVVVLATADVVWQVLTDVERWPEWTPSVTEAKRLDDGPLRVGSRVVIKQPRMTRMEWEVRSLHPFRSFSWSTTSVGVTTVATHDIEEVGTGTVSVSLAVRHTGPLAPLVRLLTTRMTRRYLSYEAEGLKRRCEQNADRS